MIFLSVKCLMDLCFRLIIVRDRLDFTADDYMSMALTSKEMMEIVLFCLRPLTLSIVDREVISSIKEFGMEHFLARVTSSLVASRFLDVFGFISCEYATVYYCTCENIEDEEGAVVQTLCPFCSENSTRKNPLAECIHWRAGKSRSCSIDKRDVDGKKYNTTNPINNALSLFDYDVFARIVKESKYNINYLEWDGINKLMILVAETQNPELMFTTMKLGVTTNHMGKFIHNFIIEQIEDIEIASDMILALLSTSNRDVFGSDRFLDINQLFCRCTKFEHIDVLIKCGLDLNRASHFVRVYINMCSDIIRGDDYTIEESHSWLKLFGLFGRMEWGGNNDMFDVLGQLTRLCEEKIVDQSYP